VKNHAIEQAEKMVPAEHKAKYDEVKRLEAL
jgi:hypothetical protein